MNCEWRCREEYNNFLSQNQKKKTQTKPKQTNKNNNNNSKKVLMHCSYIHISIYLLLLTAFNLSIFQTSIFNNQISLHKWHFFHFHMRIAKSSRKKNNKIKVFLVYALKRDNSKEFFFNSRKYYSVEISDVLATNVDNMLKVVHICIFLVVSRQYRNESFSTCQTKFISYQILTVSNSSSKEEGKRKNRLIL